MRNPGLTVKNAKYFLHLFGAFYACSMKMIIYNRVILKSLNHNFELHPESVKSKDSRFNFELCLF